jgi:hypothetical protein
MSTVNWSIQHKRDTAANFTANNPILLAGQLGIETDGLTTTPKFKIGDGVNTWTALPYFYGGSASAQNLNNVLTVGNTTTGKNIVLTDDDIIQVGSTANRKIGFNTSTIVGGLELVNLNSNDHIILQDAGGIHIDTTYIQVPQVTASRILATDANNKITGAYTTTGSGTVLALSTSPTFTTDITTPAATISGNISASAWTTNGISIKQASNTYTDTSSSGTVANAYTNRFGGGTILASSATTYTNYFGSYFTIPAASTGATITNAYAAGFGGAIRIVGNLGSNASIMVDNSTGGYGALWSDATQALILRITSGDIVQLGDLNAKNKGIGFVTNRSTRVSIAAGGGMTFADANNISFNTTTGTKIGTATTQKLAFWNATPIVQPTTAVAAATLSSLGGTALTSTDTFDGYTLLQVVKALRNIGLLA